ncbi:hypothetical protein PA598K_02982 [Paenibacillus sp. 598K]|nr:hypothetical protein PA598K_02982 [Paenibacillus sp. 598K]
MKSLMSRSQLLKSPLEPAAIQCAIDHARAADMEAGIVGVELLAYEHLLLYRQHGIVWLARRFVQYRRAGSLGSLD